MKHTIKVTVVLIAIFLLTQIIGLATVSKYIKVESTAEGEKIIKHDETVIGPQPEIKEKSYSAVPIIISVLVGTAVVLLLMRFKLGQLWRLWFFIAVLITLSVSFDVYMPRLYAVILAIVLAAIKTFRPNIIVHNVTEIFVYTGIAIIILPYLNMVSAFTLLLLISVYDIYAVWKSKHMIKLAKFQTSNKVFAGLLLQYSPDKKKRDYTRGNTPMAKNVKADTKQRNAILGGGDVAFPLMFSTAVMEHLILYLNLTKQAAFIQTLIITLFTTIALAILFVKSKKNKFYPAMPFLTLGCIMGYVVIWLVNLYLFHINIWSFAF